MAKLSRSTRNKLSYIAFALAVIITLIMAAKSRRETIIKLQAAEETIDAIQAMLDTDKFGYAIVDSRGKVVEWNRALENLTGKYKSELLEQGLKVVMTEEAWAKHSSAFKHAMNNPDLANIIRVSCIVPSVQEKEKKETPVEVTLRVVRGRHGNLYAIAHIDKKSNITTIHGKL